MKKLMTLKKYDPSDSYKIRTRKEVSKNAEDLFETRNKIINAFRDLNFGWMHRSSNELRDLIEKIKSNSNLGAKINGKKLH